MEKQTMQQEHQAGLEQGVESMGSGGTQSSGSREPRQVE